MSRAFRCAPEARVRLKVDSYNRVKADCPTDKKNGKVRAPT